MRLDAATARDRFIAARVARLATVAADGRPHLVPLVFGVVGDTIVSAVDDKPKASVALARLGNVADEPRVALLVDHYDEDWSTLWWVRADGVGRVVDQPAADPAAAAGLAVLASKYPQQTVVGAALLVTVERWSGWAAG